ncbi:hypothetical protein [Bradyrhizobium japonicum]|nr:hypothetical protein [Bradyrhizobium japonicum]
MRNFGIVDQKLEEADFFCDLVAEGGADVRRVSHYFSAYVAAARSVTFALQASISGADGFADWYTGWQRKLKQDNLARFFHACRTDTQHIGLNPVRACWSSREYKACFFRQPELGRYDWLPEVDVATACHQHMKLLCELMRDCYQVFGMLIDPDQIYTAEGLAAKGWSLEDVEEQLGFPRGYTDIPWEGQDKDAQRLKLLRRNIALSGIGPTLSKYLDEASATGAERGVIEQ